MKKILILYPHFPPSNLAGVHRARLFAQHLPAFGWEPIILTVDEKFYEEAPDHNLVKLLPASLRVEKVKAFHVTKPRLIGDIGLRAFFQLYKRAKQLIESESIDFLYISLASFYCSLLGRWLNATTGIRYGIDYQDPWVHFFPGSEKLFSRHWYSTNLAKFLEPIAVKKASLITGVAEKYYLPVLQRNPHLKNIITGAMPVGGEEADHEIAVSLKIEPYLFKKKKDKLQLLYAGTMLSKAYEPLEKIFEAIVANNDVFKDVEFHFIGSGKKPDDPNGYNIKPLAEKFGLWETVIFEYPQRIPYLDVLVHLDNADAVFILGSTEAHYTPSKVYQGILAGKAILAVLHKESSAAKVIEDANAGKVLTFNGIEDICCIKQNFANTWKQFRNYLASFKPGDVNMVAFNKYSAKSVTKQLADLLDKVI